MPAPNKALKHWQSIIADPNSAPERKDDAAKEIEKIKRRYARLKAGRNKKSNYDPAKDPEPAHHVRCGWLSCDPSCKWTGWKARQDEYREVEPPKQEEFLNELQIDSWATPTPKPVVKPAPKKIALPMPKITLGPKPAPVVRKTREGHSGFFFDEVYWNLSPFDRQCQNLFVKADPKLQMELRGIQEALTTEAAMYTPVQKPLTDEEKKVQDIANEVAKRRAFSAPSVLPHDEAFAVGQSETVDEHREKYATTMGNVTPDSGLSVEPDRRGWLPDTPAKELTPSRCAE